MGRNIRFESFYRNKAEMKKIALSGKKGNGKFALVDNSDYEYLNQFKWHISSPGYPTRGIWSSQRKQNKLVNMHRELIKSEKGFEIDHINGDKLDNRRSNLRIVTHKQNIANQKLQSKSRSGYKGVSYYKNYKKWEAYICTNKKKYRLGYFITKEEGALAYNQAAIKYFGEFARLNRI